MQFDNDTYQITELPIINVDDPAIVAACEAADARPPPILPAPSYKRYHPYVGGNSYDEFNAAWVVYPETVNIIRGIVTNTDPNNVPPGAIVNGYCVMSRAKVMIRYRIGSNNVDRCDIVHIMNISDHSLDKLQAIVDTVRPVKNQMIIYTMAVRQYITNRKLSTIYKKLHRSQLIGVNTIKHLSEQHIR